MFERLVKFVSGKDTKKSKQKRRAFDFRRDESSAGSIEVETKRKLLNLLNFTKTSGTSYAAISHPAGYHTIEIGGEVLRGQRDPHKRLKNLDYDFRGKTLLDVGCNQGGMVFAVAEEIKWGVGIDYDFKMVNACNAIRSKLHVSNCDFYVHDLDQVPMGLIEDYLPENRVNIVFLLAVCMWIDCWRELISFLSGMSDNMLFETNGKPHQQEEQYQYLKKRYADVALISDSSPDDEGQKKRRLYFCSEPKVAT